MPRLVFSSEFVVHRLKKFVHCLPSEVKSHLTKDGQLLALRDFEGLIVNCRPGVTLVELLIVITIVGVLSSLSFGVISNRQADARDAQRKVDLAAISTALELYYQQNSAYPPSAITDPIDTNPRLYSSNNSSNPWVLGLTKSYIKSLPEDPKQNLSVTSPYDCDVTLPLYNYCYIARPDRQSFELWAKLEKTNDPEIHDKPGAKCSISPPNASFNYCIKSN